MSIASEFRVCQSNMRERKGSEALAEEAESTSARTFSGTDDQPARLSFRKPGVLRRSAPTSFENQGDKEETGIGKGKAVAISVVR